MFTEDCRFKSRQLFQAEKKKNMKENSLSSNEKIIGTNDMTVIWSIFFKTLLSKTNVFNFQMLDDLE